jgi:hypothetical protein
MTKRFLKKGHMYPSYLPFVEEEEALMPSPTTFCDEEQKLASLSIRDLEPEFMFSDPLLSTEEISTQSSTRSWWEGEILTHPSTPFQTLPLNSPPLLNSLEGGRTNPILKTEQIFADVPAPPAHLY